MVIEAAHFDAMTIARTSRRHKLSSEASAASSAASTRPRPTPPPTGSPSCWSSSAAGTLVAAETVVGAAPAPAADHDRRPTCRRAIARHDDRPPTTVRRLLRVGGLRRSTATAWPTLTVTPPSWRPDLTDPYDYVEEVVRLVGYDTIPSRAAGAPAGPRADPRPAARGAVIGRRSPPPGSSRC